MAVSPFNITTIVVDDTSPEITYTGVWIMSV